MNNRDNIQTGGRSVQRTLVAVLVAITFGAIAVEPVLAQSGAAAFCSSAIADTIKNVFTLIQFGGPLIGGVIALGSTVGLSVVNRSDKRQELKEMRNQALIWGVLVAPLATVIIIFLLNNIVAGGSSCSF